MKCVAFMNTVQNKHAMNKGALIDNYDSFTYNLKALFETQGAELDVFRNDKVSIEQLNQYDYLVLSPGPSRPKDAGDLLEIIETFKYDKPIFGVCLGMQAIAEVFGGELMLLEKPLHGISKMVTHFGDSIFDGLDTYFEAGRYHSLAVSKENFPQELEVIAVSVEKKIMAIKHVELPIYGFQFHPESILTADGGLMVNNFLNQININKNEKAIREII